ncbi:hypothetical protein M3Y99_00259800 [Aphelenchoides fujianensis]|nr:hypothetical protein M3Y99_00259800 [Aphelenchoides fujianensis]
MSPGLGRLLLALLVLTCVNGQYAQWSYGQYPRLAAYGYGAQQLGLGYNHYRLHDFTAAALQQQQVAVRPSAPIPPPVGSQVVQPAVSAAQIANHYRPAAPSNPTIYTRPLSPTAHVPEREPHMPGVFTLAQQAAAAARANASTAPPISGHFAGGGQPRMPPTASHIHGPSAFVQPPPRFPSAHGQQPAAYAITKTDGPRFPPNVPVQQQAAHFQKQQQQRVGGFGSVQTPIQGKVVSPPPIQAATHGPSLTANGNVLQQPQQKSFGSGFLSTGANRNVMGGALGAEKNSLNWVHSRARGGR